MADISRLIFRKFKAQGLSINGDAASALLSVLAREENVEQSLRDILDAINRRIEKREVKKSLIDVEIISSVVYELSSTDDDIHGSSLQLINAFGAPKLIYDEKTKSFRVDPNPAYQLHGSVESRSHMYRERLLLNQQRLLRSGAFVLKGMNSSSNSKTSSEILELSTVESLLGSKGRKTIFGMITQPEEGKLYLEDLNSAVPLDISQAGHSNTLLTEGCHVIAEGEFLDGLFRVVMLAFPFAEERRDTLKSIGIADIFGNGDSAQQIENSYELERNALDSMIIIISDLQIEKPLVLEKLRQVFEGFEGTGVYPLFVLMGSFVTKAATVSGGRDAVSNSFANLAEIIASCPDIAQNSKFLLVPGSRDPGLAKVLPRRPIPDIFLKDLQKKVKNISFASNPCRLRFYTQEIVFFREDLLKKMQRYSLIPSATGFGGDLDGASEIIEQLVKSVIEQAHLWPLPPSAKPIYWELDYTLRLNPLPHLIILGDQVDQFLLEHSGCKVVNPGSFSSDYSFVVYRPATQAVEFSRVP